MLSPTTTIVVVRQPDRLALWRGGRGVVRRRRLILRRRTTEKPTEGIEAPAATAAAGNDRRTGSRIARLQARATPRSRSDCRQSQRRTQAFEAPFGCIGTAQSRNTITEQLPATRRHLSTILQQKCQLEDAGMHTRGILAPILTILNGRRRSRIVADAKPSELSGRGLERAQGVAALGQAAIRFPIS